MSPHKISGILLKHNKPKLTYLKTAQVFGKIMQGENVELKQRAYFKETVKRAPYNREEDRIRPLIIKELRHLGWKVTRVEPTFHGEFNLGDTWISNEYKKLAGWCEIKSLIGKQTSGQKDFQRVCELCGVHYWIIRTVKECKNIA